MAVLPLFPAQNLWIMLHKSLFSFQLKQQAINHANLQKPRIFTTNLSNGRNKLSFDIDFKKLIVKLKNLNTHNLQCVVYMLPP